MAAVLALLSAVVYGAGDFAGGLASRRLPLAAVVLRTNLVGLAGLLVVTPLVGADRVVGGDLLVGAAGGLAGAVGILLLYHGLAKGTMSVVAPVTAVLSAIVPVGYGLATGERPAVLALAGIPVALVAIVLLARDPDAEGPEEGMPPSILGAALLSGLCFGIFFVCLDAAGDDAGLWPVLTGRVTSVVIYGAIVAALASARVGSDAARRDRLPMLIVVCGLCDAGANALFVLATHHGMLSLVAVLGALYPASTVALATTLTHERLARPQITGVGLALLAVVAITAA